MNNTVGETITDDFKKFKWDWVMRQIQKNIWGKLTSNLLLIGQEGKFVTVICIKYFVILDSEMSASKFKIKLNLKLVHN